MMSNLADLVFIYLFLNWILQINPFQDLLKSKNIKIFSS